MSTRNLFVLALLAVLLPWSLAAQVAPLPTTETATASAPQAKNLYGPNGDFDGDGIRNADDPDRAGCRRQRLSGESASPTLNAGPGLGQGKGRGHGRGRGRGPGQQWKTGAADAASSTAWVRGDGTGKGRGRRMGQGRGNGSGQGKGRGRRQHRRDGSCLASPSAPLGTPLQP